VIPENQSHVCEGACCWYDSIQNEGIGTTKYCKEEIDMKSKVLISKLSDKPSTQPKPSSPSSNNESNSAANSSTSSEEASSEATKVKALNALLVQVTDASLDLANKKLIGIQAKPPVSTSVKGTESSKSLAIESNVKIPRESTICKSGIVNDPTVEAKVSKQSQNPVSEKEQAIVRDQRHGEMECGAK